MTEKVLQSLEGVSETLLMPLQARARESQRPDAMLKDDKAVAMVNQIAYDFSRIRLREHDEFLMIMRVHKFDSHVRSFLMRNPDAVVVHIGCGLDTRFERVDNGQVEWFDLDMPDVIELRRKVLGDEGGRYHLLGCSALEDAWLDTVSAHRQRPCLFLAE